MEEILERTLKGKKVGSSLAPNNVSSVEEMRIPDKTLKNTYEKIGE